MSNLDGGTLLDFLIDDFETAWNAMAAIPGKIPRGNFMFAFQAACLLEVACRATDDFGLESLANTLRQRDGRYFTSLPSPAPKAKFKLPGSGTHPERQLLHALFDLVRNGLAHQYQPTVATIWYGQQFQFGVTGAEHGYDLARVSATAGRDQHLAAEYDLNGDVWIRVRTDVFFVDIRDAIREPTFSLRPFRHVEAPTADAKKAYKHSAEQLVESLVSAGHFASPPRRGPDGYAPTSEPLSPTMMAQPIKSGSPDKGTQISDC